MGAKDLTPSQLEFFEACRKGDFDKVRSWLVHKRNKRPRTPLNFLRPAPQQTAWLLTIRDPSSQYTALHHAAINGHDQVCRILLDFDSLLANARDKRGCIPLHLASFNGHYNVVKYLSDLEPDTVDAINNTQESPLHLAAQNGHARIVKILLEKHSDPCLRNARHETPLDIAAKNGHATVVKIVIASNPELALLSASECSTKSKALVVYPMHAAARHSHVACLQLLRSGGFDINFSTEEGSALHVAAMYGQSNAVKFLIDEGANPTIRDARGRTVLEMLEEHELQKAADLTQVIQSRDGWSECRRLIEDYINKLEGSSLNSSSDSGIDRRDSVRQKDQNPRDIIWRPLPNTSHATQDNGSISSHSNSLRVPVLKQNMTSLDDSMDDGSMISQSSRAYSDEGQSTSTATPTMSPNASTRLNDLQAGRKFPVTSPYHTTRHQRYNRASGTLPSNFAPMRSRETNSQKGTIWANDPNCVYVAPPGYDAWQNAQRVVQNDGTSHTYNPSFPYDNMPKHMSAYDNAPPPGHRRWDHHCDAPPVFGSVGRASGSALQQPPIAAPTRSDGTQTLPSSRGGRVRPALINTFPPIKEPSPDSLDGKSRETTTVSTATTARERADSLGLSHSPRLSPRAGSRLSSATFACSTLERSASPQHLSDHRPLSPPGRAPLAMPEELTGSTTNSILSASMSPEREFRMHQSMLHSTISNNTSTLRQDEYDGRIRESSLDTVAESMSLLDVDPTDGPPSPNTSQATIFDTLCENENLSAKLVDARIRQGLISPSEMSDATVASSCSLPMVSQISETPTSPSPQKRFPHTCDPSKVEVKMRTDKPTKGNGRAESRFSFNEIDEWRKIDEIMSSFGGGVCRESVFASEYEPQVAVYLRDRRSQALTIQLHPAPVQPTTARNTVIELQPENGDGRNSQSRLISVPQFINLVIGIPNPKADEIGNLLVKNGFDRISQLAGTLTVPEMNLLGIDKSIQHQIVVYLNSVNEVKANANSFNYVSDWLCSLELTDYLGNFVNAGYKSMIIVRAADLNESHLQRIGIVLRGHVCRILRSLREAREQEIREKMARIDARVRSGTPPNSSYASTTSSRSPRTKQSSPSSINSSEPEKRDLVKDCASYSAHYLGSMEISNIDGTEESRRAMTKLKLGIREIAKVPQILLEISARGVRVLDADSMNLTVEHEISRIQIVCQDERDLNCFTYITSECERNFCHVFCVLTADLATEILMTLGAAFEIAYKLMRGEQVEEVANV